MKYKDWLFNWLENYIKLTSKQRTYERYCDLIKIHIIPALGEYEINDLSIDIMQKFVSFLLREGNVKTKLGLASNTVCSIINIIQNSLRLAHCVGYAENYVADKIKRPSKEEKDIRCFSIDEQKKIEAAILSGKKKKLFGIILCFYTGLRIGELLALNWSDIDLDEGLMTISKSCHDSKDETGRYKKIMETPKTKSSKRLVPVPKQIIAMLKSLKKESKSEFVIADGAKDIAVRSYQRSFDLLLKKLGIPHRGFHSIRHTFATRALECGMDVKTLSEVLGHRNATITLNRYTHSMLSHKKEMMNRIGKLL